MLVILKIRNFESRDFKGKPQVQVYTAIYNFQWSAILIHENDKFLKAILAIGG
jgi:hypothetical protein